VTDDQALPCDQARVSAALDRADAVLMVLLAPPFLGLNGSYPGGGRPRGGQPPVFAPWPGGGGTGGPLGGIILGRRRGPSGISIPGSRPPGSMSAGSPEIARTSGGDSLNVNDASAVETTFERIRQRYAIYFYLPEGMENGRGMELDLTDTARRRHLDAALQYRQVDLAKDGAKPVLITRVPAHPPLGRDPEQGNVESSNASPAPAHRRRGVNYSTGEQVVLPVQPAVELPSAADQSRSQVTVRRRGISQPDRTSRVLIEPAQ